MESALRPHFQLQEIRELEEQVKRYHKATDKFQMWGVQKNKKAWFLQKVNARGKVKVERQL